MKFGTTARRGQRTVTTALASALLVALPSLTSQPGRIVAAAKSPRVEAIRSLPLALTVDTEGIYRLTYSYFTRLGIRPSTLNVHRLGMADDGVAVPTFVHHSSPGSSFAKSDYVEFYAHPVNNTYTSQNSYVLTDNGADVMRVSIAQAGLARNPASSAPNTYVDEQRTEHLSAGPVRTAYTVDDNWPATGDPTWKETDLLTETGDSTTTSGPIGFQLSTPTASGTCRVSVPVTGYADTTSTYTPTFDLGVQINSAQVPAGAHGRTDFLWAGRGGSIADATINSAFPCSDLKPQPAGDQTESITFTSKLQPGNQVQEVLPQSFTVSYPERLCAVDGRVQWTRGEGSYRAAGFSHSQISAWAVSGNRVRKLAHITTEKAQAICGSRSSATSFKATLPGNTRYYLSDNFLEPASARSLDLSPITRGAAESAQYLIITAPQFEMVLRPLAAYRSARGLHARIVTAASIYDQFQRHRGAFSSQTRPRPGDAQINPDAIRAYIQFAVRHFGTKYVLLAGGDTFDYHNYFGCPASGACGISNPDNVSVVPSLYVPSQYSGTDQTDNLFAVPLHARNVAPDVAIGRLPGIDSTQLKTEVQRSIAWSSEVKSYLHTALFVADPSTTACSDAGFQRASDQMTQRLSSTYDTAKLYETTASISSMTATVLTLADRPSPTLQAGTAITLNGSSQAANSTASVSAVSSSAPWTVSLSSAAPATDYTGIDWNPTVSQSRNAFFARVSFGEEIVNYTGHGNLEQWTCLPMTFQDVSSWTNPGRPAAVFQWGCQSTLLGARAPTLDSLLLSHEIDGKAAGAAIALGSSGEDLPQPQAALAGGTTDMGPGGHHYFYGYLMKGESVGVALMHAKQDLIKQFGANPDYVDVVNSYRVLGDPAIAMR